MKMKPMLTVADVDVMLAAARAEAAGNKWAVSISIVDDGGHLLGMIRLDGAGLSTVEMSREKARTAALCRRESKHYEDTINNGRFSFLSAPLLKGMLEGGVPIVVDGMTAGAIGVSGVKSPEDAQIAKAGIAALAAGA
jgi:glc operon protein GlcG